MLLPQRSDETAGSQKVLFVTAQAVVGAELAQEEGKGHVEFG